MGDRVRGGEATGPMDVYGKIARAYKRGTGTRLTAWEVDLLVTLDDAVGQVVEHILEGPDPEPEIHEPEELRDV